MEVVEKTLLNFDSVTKGSEIILGAKGYADKAASAVQACYDALGGSVRSKHTTDLTNVKAGVVNISTKLSEICGNIDLIVQYGKEYENGGVEEMESTSLVETPAVVYDEVADLAALTGATVVEDESEGFWESVGNFFGVAADVITDIVKKTLCTLANIFVAALEGLIAFIESIADALVMLVGLVGTGIGNLCNFFGADLDVEKWKQNIMDYVAVDVAGWVSNEIYSAMPFIRENSWIADTWVESGISGVFKWVGVVGTAVAITYFSAGTGTVPFLTAVLGSTGTTVAVGATSGYGSYGQKAYQNGATFAGGQLQAMIGAVITGLQSYGVSTVLKAGVSTYIGGNVFTSAGGINTMGLKNSAKAAMPTYAAPTSQPATIFNRMLAAGGNKITQANTLLNVSSNKIAGGILNRFAPVLGSNFIHAPSMFLPSQPLLGTAGFTLVNGVPKAIAASGLSSATKIALAGAGILGAGTIANNLNNPTSAPTTSSGDGGSGGGSNGGSSNVGGSNGGSSNVGGSNGGSLNGGGSSGNIPPVAPVPPTSSEDYPVEKPSIPEEIPNDDVLVDDNVDEDMQQDYIPNDDVNNQVNLDSYQEALRDEISELYDTNSDLLREKLADYGYTQEEIDHLMSSEDLVQEAILNRETLDRIDLNTTVKNLYFQDPAKLESMLADYGYSDKEIDMIMKDSNLAYEATINGENSNKFGIKDTYFEDKLELLDMYETDQDGLVEYMKDLEFTDREIEELLKVGNKNNLIESVLAKKRILDFDEGISGDIEEKVDPSISYTASGGTIYDSGVGHDQMSNDLEDLIGSNSNIDVNTSMNQGTVYENNSSVANSENMSQSEDILVSKNLDDLLSEIDQYNNGNVEVTNATSNAEPVFESVGATTMNNANASSNASSSINQNVIDSANTAEAEMFMGLSFDKDGNLVFKGGE